MDNCVNNHENVIIPVIKPETNYWFVRTNAGQMFQDFYFENFIAIGWDKLTNLEEIKEAEIDELKLKVSELYNDNDIQYGAVASQIIRFVSEMKIGDIVLIPSENCNIIAFGTITSDPYIYEPTPLEKLEKELENEEYEPTFLKRRKVKWMTTPPLKRNEIDTLLLNIIYSHNTIVDANPYADFINRTLYNIYYRNGALHTIFDVTNIDDISAYDFNEFINTLFKTLDGYSEITGDKIDKKELSIKASINSPGPVEIITYAASSILVLTSIALFLNGVKLKFNFDIKIAEFQFDVDTPGLIDKINDATKIKNDKTIKMEEIENDLVKSKDALKLQMKKLKPKHEKD